MENEEALKRIEIVLVDTQDGANIGSVCRAMKTMGLENLVMVSEKNRYDENRVRTLALHASDVWENAKFCSSLDLALKDSTFSVAATRRRGKFRKLSSFSPEQLATLLSERTDEKVSIVFGRESDGLRDDEVNKCSSIVTIPTSDKFPSLNLSQAVQIICYELYKSALVYKSGMTAVKKERIKESVDEMSGHLKEIGYYKWDEETKWTEQLLSDIIERAYLSESELQRFEKIFRKTEDIVKYRNKKEEI